MPASRGRRLKPVPTVVKQSSDTVVVACKMPNGIVLQNTHMEPYREAVPGGFRESKRAIREPETYVLNGSALKPEIIQSGDLPYAVVHGAALTHGVPREFWERWLHANAGSDLVKRHVVFAHKSEASVRAMAKEFSGSKTGLEPIDPDPAALNRRVQPPRGMRIEPLRDERLDA